MVGLFNNYLFEIFDRYNIPIDPNIVIVLSVLGLTIIWFIIRFFLRLTIRIFFFGLITIVLLGVCLFIFLYLL